MKKLLMAVCLFAAACNSNPSADTAPGNKANTKALSDSLYDQAMDIHNEIMPKMSKLMGYQKEAQKQSDSIKVILSSTSFPVEVSRRIAADVNKLDTLNENLKAADQAMNDWMDQFDPDPKLPTEAEKAAYFADQKQKAEAMKVKFMRAYQQAEVFFDKPKN